MKTSFINNILNSQPILIKFALKIICVQMPVFSDAFTSWFGVPLIIDECGSK